MNSVEVIKGQGLVARRGNIQEFERQRVAAYCRVSTDSEDQLSSYKSQVQHYTEFIKSKNEWVFAGIYADEAITGTQTKKREDFQRLINDCMNGEIDLVITKSISRFARNTLDTLRYVRMLKEKNVAVFFEEENINTLTMDGELLLVILSSVAQQEVENISANVKKGLKMKMQRGEIVGFQGCLGYDYHPEDKSLTVNEEEANIVRYIFQRYIEGTGCTILSNELKNLGYKTKRGLTSWPASTVINIIKNEKYKGDLLLGKTFTVDPISKRRLVNFGEEDKFYIKGHHDPIVSEEVFAKAQEILAKRGYPRRLNPDGKREKYSRKYAFSSLLQCGFCDTTLSRRSWHASERHKKLIWQCTLATKKGKKYCPESKGIEESIIEEAFLEAYKLLCGNDKSIVDDFLALAEETLTEANVEKIISRTERDLVAAENKKSKLIDLRLEGTIDDDAFSSKLFDLDNNIDTLKSTLNDLSVTKNQQDDLRSRILSFKAILESNQVLEKFDRFVFESIVEKVVIGGYEEGGAPDPGLITFVFKTGYKQKLHKNNYGIARRQFDQDGNAILPSSSSQTEDFSASSYASANTACFLDNLRLDVSDNNFQIGTDSAG